MSIALEFGQRIVSGELAAGSVLPTNKQLSARYGVSAGTVHRAVALPTSGV